MLKDLWENAQNIWKKRIKEKRVFKGIDIFDLPKSEKIFDVPIMAHEILDLLIGIKECIFRTSRLFEKQKCI